MLVIRLQQIAIRSSREDFYSTPRPVPWPAVKAGLPSYLGILQKVCSSQRFVMKPLRCHQVANYQMTLSRISKHGLRVAPPILAKRTHLTLSPASIWTQAANIGPFSPCKNSNRQTSTMKPGSSMMWTDLSAINKSLSVFHQTSSPLRKHYCDEHILI